MTSQRPVAATIAAEVSVGGAQWAWPVIAIVMTSTATVTRGRRWDHEVRQPRSPGGGVEAAAGARDQSGAGRSQPPPCCDWC